jgi:hypothetical protein
MVSRPLQKVQLWIHRLSPETLSPNHKDNHSNDRKANSQCHHCHDRWNETIFDCPIVVIEDHAELWYISGNSYQSCGKAYPKSVLYNSCRYHDLARDVLVAIYSILQAGQHGYREQTKWIALTAMRIAGMDTTWIPTKPYPMITTACHGQWRW